MLVETALLIVSSVMRLSEEVFGEVMVLAEVTLVSCLLLALVRWTGGGGLLLVGKALLIVSSVVKVSERVEFLTVSPSEELETEAEDPAKEVILPSVGAALAETVTAPDTVV